MTVLTRTDDLHLLIATLPPPLQDALQALPQADDLLEIVMDLGRQPQARFPGHAVNLSDEAVSREDLNHVVGLVGEFGVDNRAGIEGTLHRISALRNRRGQIIGLTLRVGRAVFGTIDTIRDLVERGVNVLLLGRPGVGKCVASDTWLFTERGMLQIVDFAPQHLKEETFYPLELGLATLNGQEKTSHFYYDGIRKTHRLRTWMGYELEGTENHPILVMGVDGELSFKPLGAIAAGDHVAIQRDQGLFGNEVAINGFNFQLRTNAKDECLIPEYLTGKLARYLGYLVAEGTTTYRYYTVFTNDDSDVVEDVRGLVRTLFGLELKKTVENERWSGRDYRIGGRKHRAFLEHLGLSYVRSADKRIPDCILRAPRSVIAGFLRGFFEGEGSIGRQFGVEVSSASAGLMRQLHVLLLNFGIIAKLRARVNRNNGKSYHYLNIKGENVAIFAREIGFVSTRKRAALAAIEGQVRNPNLDVIPHLQDALLALRAQIAMAQPRSRTMVAAGGRSMPSLVTGYKAAHPMLSKYTRTGQSVSYKTLGRILEETRDLEALPIRQRLEAIHQLGFFYDGVTAIEDREAPVYDFTVPVSHSFFSNGLVSHNTTKLREVARVLADEFGRRVIVIDTSNEIGGDGDIPHPAIGSARRMQVPHPDRQHAVMIEAVENHMPEVIIVDEIGTAAEAIAARTIAERGVQLIGTAHGNTLENLIMNPTLCDLVGGVQTVTLGDEEARLRGTQKTISERKAPPTFDAVVEIVDRDELIVHPDTAEAVDRLLRGVSPSGERRTRGTSTALEEPEPPPRPQAPRPGPPMERRGPLRIYAHAVSRDSVERAIRDLGLDGRTVKRPEQASLIVTLRSRANDAPLRRLVQASGLPLYDVKKNTTAQIRRLLQSLFPNLHDRDDDEVSEAMREAEAAARRVLDEGVAVELAPRPAALRRLQHRIVARHRLVGVSEGREPLRRLVIHPN